MSSAARVTRQPKPVRQLPAAVPSLPVRRFTLTEYHYLIEIGFLHEDDRVELLNGWIVSKMGINPPHAAAVTRLARRLFRLLGDDWLIRQQDPITIPASDSEPEPDVVVVPGPEGSYDRRHPHPKDVALLVEVADSSLREARGEKFRTYAAARVPVYWVVNLVDRQVEVYTDPRGGKNPTYRTSATYGPDDSVPVVVGGATLAAIPVAELLPGG